MEAVKEAAAEAVKKRDVAGIGEDRMQSAEYWRRDWVVNAEQGTTREDILKPGYWALVAYKMHAYDHIEVRLETGEWLAELLVLPGSERTFAYVALLHFHQLSAVSLPEVSPLFRVDWKGPQHKWAVIRVSDSAMLKNGFENKAKAQEWLTNHERATV